VEFATPVPDGGDGEGVGGLSATFGSSSTTASASVFAVDSAQCSTLLATEFGSLDG